MMASFHFELIFAFRSSVQFDVKQSVNRFIYQMQERLTGKHDTHAYTVQEARTTSRPEEKTVYKYSDAWCPLLSIYCCLIFQSPAPPFASYARIWFQSEVASLSAWGGLSLLVIAYAQRIEAISIIHIFLYIYIYIILFLYFLIVLFLLCFSYASYYYSRIVRTVRPFFFMSIGVYNTERRDRSRTFASIIVFRYSFFSPIISPCLLLARFRSRSRNHQKTFRPAEFFSRDL